MDVERGVDECSALPLIEDGVEGGGRGGVGVTDGVDENEGVTKLNDSTGRKDEGKDIEEDEVAESEGSEQEVAAAAAVVVADEGEEEEGEEEVGQFSSHSNEDKKST